MEVVIIGTGNVATVLSKLVIEKGHFISAIVGRELHKTQTIVTTIGGKALCNIANVPLTADIYIVAIADDAIADVANQLLLGNKLVVHTAGSISKDILARCTSNYGVLWPLQTLRKETEKIPSIPFVIDANNNDTLNKLETFAKSLSTQCYKANDAERIKLHLGAVVASNFTNHLFALAENYYKNEGLDFKLLLPLINETVSRIQNHSPKDVQTGPAVRGDLATIEKHLNLLKGYPDLKHVYELLSSSIGKK